MPQLVDTPPPVPIRGVTPPALWPAMTEAWLKWQAKSAPQLDALGQLIVALAAQAAADASAAGTAAMAAVNAPGTFATSTALRTLGVGFKTFPIEAGKLFAVGQDIIAAYRPDATKRMVGVATTVVDGSITIFVPGADYVDGAGEYDDWQLSLGVKRAASIPTATAADVWARINATAAIPPAVLAAADVYQSVANTPTITLDLNAGRNFVIDPYLGGAHTLANPTNLAAGKGGLIKAKQPPAGGASMAFGSSWRRQGGAATLSTAGNAEDWILYEGVSSSVALYTIIKSPS